MTDTDDIYRIQGRTDVRTIVDIGANVGAYVVLAARFYPDARIIAYEPDPDKVAILRSRIDHNKCRAVGYGVAVLDEMTSYRLSDIVLVEAISLEQALPIHEDIDILRVDAIDSTITIFKNAPREVMQRVKYFSIKMAPVNGSFATLRRLLETHELRQHEDNLWTGELR